MSVTNAPLTNSEPAILRQIAYQRFKEALFSGRIKPGDFLSQREICELIDVPLGPMREALKSLEAESIATLLPKRGIRVIQIDPRAFAKAIEARVLIEGEAAERFAIEGPMDEIEEIARQTRGFQARYEASSDPGDEFFSDKNRVDFLLHDSMMDFLGNPILTYAYKAATEHVRIFRLNIAANQNFFELPAVEEHLEILEALLQRNPTRAREALSKHLQGALLRALPGYR